MVILKRVALFYLVVLVGLSYFGCLELAEATNGLKMIGVGAINRGMGGAGVAAPQDTNAMVINPAGLSRLGTSLDISLDTHFSKTHMDSAGSLGNSAVGKLESPLVNYIPTFGVSYALEDSPLVLGWGLFGLAGCGVDYEMSRLGSANNNFDKHVQYEFMTVASTAAWEFNDRLSLGLSANFDYTTFDSDGANSSMAQTAGNDNKDEAKGGGFVLGAIYDLSSEFSLGLAYTSRQWMKEFDKYQDLLPRLDMAQQWAAGIAYRPEERWLFVFDIKWIDWDSVSVLKNTPANGGFGWRDQYIYALGGQYKLTPQVSLRAGYNYGRAPIREDRVFANTLFPAVGEHHLDLGVGVEISEKNSFSLTYEHGFKHGMTDNGQGDAYSSGGVGTEIDFRSNAVICQWGVKF